MIKFTGLIEANNAYYKDGYIVLVPHLAPFGQTTIDAHICKDEAGAERLTTIAYNQVDKSIYNNAQGNSYDDMISKLRQFVMDDLQAINPDCTFEIVSPTT